MNTAQGVVPDVPAYKLQGLTLSGGWNVISRHPRPEEATGGKYSVCYCVERNGQRAFLKALDFSRVKDAPDFVVALESLTAAFNFEREILQTCSARRMDRVISPLEDGEVKVDDSFLGRVNYLIFEQADCDVRQQLATIDRFDVTWKLRALHHIATGLWQLHNAGIAHQDVKPSNVLKFGDISKVSDLGCASAIWKLGPQKYEGDKTYAPPEILYRYVDPDFSARRYGCDLYLLGSMVVFFFSGVSATAGMLSHLHAEHRPFVWRGAYAEVLPYVRNAFGLTIRSFSKELQANTLQIKLREIVTQLCEPDPALRGHPRNMTGIGNQYSLERYVAKFDLLASQSRLGLLK